MPDDISSVRAELKGWERNFKAENNREPSVQDIKAHPAIAERYKLYKRLNKLASSRQSQLISTSPSNPPSTPPRKRPDLPRSTAGPASHHLIFEKPKAVSTEVPSFSSNPFSPSKSSRRHDNSGTSIFNLSKSPTKEAGYAETKQSYLSHFAIEPTRLFSEVVPHDGMEDDHPHVSVTKTPSGEPAALVRARKRLRGEPVSPSPNKDKRRRVAGRNTSLFPKTQPSLELAVLDEETFIEDSPLKVRHGASKAFETLFDEDIIPSPDFSGRSSKAPSSVSEASSPDDMADEPPTTDFEDEADLYTPSTSGFGKVTSIATGSVSRNASVRLSDDMDDTAHGHRGEAPLTDEPQHPSLLPPSPRRATNRPYRPNYKSGQGSKAIKVNEKAVASFSKSTRGSAEHVDPALNADHVSNSDSPARNTDMDEDPHVRVYDWNASRRALLDVQSASSDFDPEFDFALTRRRHVIIDPPLDDETDGGRLEVNVTDDLKNVLALPSEKLSEASEERVPSGPVRTRSSKHEQALARAVISGSRVGHYDSSRGGEIWNVGEMDEEEMLGEQHTMDSGGEDDDWEGEGQPWEAGEL